MGTKGLGTDYEVLSLAASSVLKSPRKSHAQLSSS